MIKLRPFRSQYWLVPHLLKEFWGGAENDARAIEAEDRIATASDPVAAP
jgi:hypothetical protein